MTKKTLKYVKDAFLVIAGTFLMGFSFNVFLNANKISPSGFGGLCAILSNVLKDKFSINISASIFYLIINAVLFIFAYKNMGIRFAINSAIGIIGYSIFMEVCNFNIGLASGDFILSAIYGGVIMGLGLGFVFRGRGSTGGSDMLANLLNKKFKFITTGNLVFIVDFIVVCLSFIAYGDLNLALYSLIAIWVMTKISDIVVAGVQGVRAYYIVSSKYEEMAEVLKKELYRGVTGFNAQGMYSKKDTIVLMTLISKSESAKLRQIVARVDKNAFMFSCPISEAMGNGFLPLDKVKANKQKENLENISENIVEQNKGQENQINLKQQANIKIENKQE